MTNQKDILFPEVEVRSKLYCPHCGSKLFSWDDSYFSKCPHVIYGHFSSACDPDFFLGVRPDFAKAFLDQLLKSYSYLELLDIDELEPLSERHQTEFINAAFSPEDPIAELVARYCQGLPERLFPSLFSRSTIIFVCNSFHSGVRIAVDQGGE